MDVRSRVWTPFAVAFGAALAAHVATAVVLVVAGVVLVALDPSSADELLSGMQEGHWPDWLFALGLVANVVVLAAVPVAATARSWRTIPVQLGLRRGDASLPALVPLAVAGVALGPVTAGLASLVLPETAFAFTAQLQGLEGAPPGEIVLVALAVTLGPPIGEELLFRGYLQRRLLARWSPPVAIGVASLMFCAFHLHPVHAVLVLPLSLWLGYVTWKVDSVLPAMVIHAINNGVAVVGSLLLPESTPTWVVVAAALACLVPAAVLTLRGLGSPRPEVAV